MNTEKPVAAVWKYDSVLGYAFFVLVATDLFVLTENVNVV